MAKLTDNERIDALKKFLGMTMKEMAARCDLKPFNFYDIKKEKCGISRFVADRICRAFPQINPQWLLDGEGEMVVSQSASQSPAMVNVPSSLLESLYSELHSLREEVAALNKRMADLEAKRTAPHSVSPLSMVADT